jgi:hypothetical protein
MPLMAPGCGALPEVTANVLAVEVPQALVAVTLTAPLVVVGVAEMLVPEDEPPQPEGSVQL